MGPKGDFVGRDDDDAPVREPHLLVFLYARFVRVCFEFYSGTLVGWTEIRGGGVLGDELVVL